MEPEERIQDEQKMDIQSQNTTENEQNTTSCEQNPENNEQIGAENEQPENNSGDEQTDESDIETTENKNECFPDAEITLENFVPLSQFQKLSDDYNAVTAQNSNLEKENQALGEKLQIANESIRQEQAKVQELSEALVAKPRIDSTNTKYVFAACSRTDYIISTDYTKLLNQVSLLPTTKRYEIFLCDGSLLDINPEIKMDDVKAKSLCRLERF